jgi:hypothetical protein
LAGRLSAVSTFAVEGEVDVQAAAAGPPKAEVAIMGMDVTLTELDTNQL